jgi:hypothetical protein
MALETLLTNLEKSFKFNKVTPVTRTETQKVTDFTFKINAVTHETPVTPFFVKVESTVKAVTAQDVFRVWEVTFNDGSKLKIHASPACNHLEIMKIYQNLLSAKPVKENDHETD